MEKFEMGEMVFAATDLYNDELAEDGRSLIPDMAPQALIAKTGKFGYPLNRQSCPAILIRSAPRVVSRNTLSPSAGRRTTASKWPYRR